MFTNEADLKDALQKESSNIMRLATYRSFSARMLTVVRMGAREREMPYFTSWPDVNYVHGNFGDASRRKPVSKQMAAVRRLVTAEFAGIQAFRDEDMQDIKNPATFVKSVSDGLASVGAWRIDENTLVGSGGTVPTGWSPAVADLAAVTTYTAGNNPFDNAVVATIAAVRATGGNPDRILISNDAWTAIMTIRAGQYVPTAFVPGTGADGRIGSFQGIPVWLDPSLTGIPDVMTFDSRNFVLGIRTNPEFMVSREAVLSSFADDGTTVIEANMYQEDGWAIRYAFRAAYLALPAQPRVGEDYDETVFPAAKATL